MMKIKIFGGKSFHVCMGMKALSTSIVSNTYGVEVWKSIRAFMAKVRLNCMC